LKHELERIQGVASPSFKFESQIKHLFDPFSAPLKFRSAFSEVFFAGPLPAVLSPFFLKFDSVGKSLNRFPLCMNKGKEHPGTISKIEMGGQQQTPHMKHNQKTT